VRHPGGHAVFFWAPEAGAEIFRLGTWGGSLEGTAALTRQEYGTDGSSSRSESRRAEERLTITNQGAYLLHPDIVTLSLGGTFGLAQSWYRSGDQEDDGASTLSGYDATMTLLRRQALSLTVFADRRETSIEHALAGRTELLHEARGLTLAAARLYIPSILTVRQDRRDEETLVSDTVTRRENRRTIIRYDGRRGWLNSDVDIHYEFVDDADPLFPSLDSQSHAGSLRYGREFGTDLNWHWDSSLAYRMLIGRAESTNWSVDESLRIDHSPSLRTDYRYLLQRYEAPSTESTAHSASVSLTHRLYENLSTTPGLEVLFVDQTFGETESYRGRLHTTYTKRLPSGGRLSASLGGSLQYQEDRFEAAESAVTQETHVVSSPIAQPIALGKAFVVQGSVVVSKIAEGPLPVGCLPAPALPAPLTPGLDYDLSAVGDTTEIVPRPCTPTTLGVNPGDTIAVDYRFSVGPSRALLRTALNADVAVDYTWIRVFLRHTQSEETLLEGTSDGFLIDDQTDTVGADLRYDGGRLRARLGGEAGRTDAARQTYDSLRASASVDLDLPVGMALGLTTDHIRTMFRNDDRETQSTSARLGVSYGAAYRLATLVLDASASFHRLEDTRQTAPEQLVELHLGLRGIFRQLEVVPTFDVSQRERGESQSRQYRFLLRTIRRF